MSKYLIIFILACTAHNTFGQHTNPDSIIVFKENFEKISSLYLTNAIPYFENFCINQLVPLPASSSKDILTARKILIESKVKTLEAKALQANAEILDILLKEISLKNEIISKNRINSILQSMYEFEFPGLDFNYYNKVNEAVKDL
jgi:hypothetical protein